LSPNLIITADDFGYRPSYDAGILEAVAAGAVDAVSVMVGQVGEVPEALRDSGAALGVHLQAMAEDGLRRGDVESQLGLFRELVGREPDYVDGHHHCHAVGEVAAVVAEIAATGGLPVRSVDEGHRRLLRAAGVRTPDLLIGRYEEGQPVLPAELESLPGGWTEWMVHPGHPAGDRESDYDAGREEDLRALLTLRLPTGVRRGDHRSLPSPAQEA
jgi:predicted glycoside hydrolase/deacetylase ChbG (UPF0249 family)